MAFPCNFKKRWRFKQGQKAHTLLIHTRHGPDSLFFMDRRSLCLHSLRSLDLADDIDVFAYAPLGPDTSPESHSGNLEEDFELRSQATVDTRSRGQPVREALEGAVKEPILEKLFRKWRWPRLGLRWRRRRRRGRELERMWEAHNHMGDDRDGAELVSQLPRQFRKTS